MSIPPPGDAFRRQRMCKEDLKGECLSGRRYSVLRTGMAARASALSPCAHTDLCELAGESLALLREAAFDARFPALFSPDVYGAIIGMFELNNLSALWTPSTPPGCPVPTCPRLHAGPAVLSVSVRQISDICKMSCQVHAWRSSLVLRALLDLAKGLQCRSLC